MRLNEPRFNDDLLLDESDRERAAQHYPTIIHVLDDPELKACFLRFDVPANRAKRKSRMLGSIAIVLGAIAVMGASAEMVFPNKEDPWLRIIAVFASLCGIGSIIVGAVGLLFGRAKREWLHMRLMGERLRQWHFQSFILGLPAIAASLKGDKAKVEFLKKRKKAFEDFVAEFEPRLPSFFAEVIESDKTECWVAKPAEVEHQVGERAELKPLFSAYRELRIRHQLNYVTYKLRSDHRVLSDAARRQVRVLETVGLSGIVLLFITHVVIAVGVALNASFAAFLVSNLLNVGIIWIATLALAARAFEQGLQPEREIERYQQYRSSVQAILQRFDASRTEAQQLRAMRQMEQLAFDEMRNFLLTHERSHFVM